MRAEAARAVASEPTPAQQRVLGLLAAQDSNGGISAEHVAEQLGMTKGTVYAHVRAMKSKGITVPAFGTSSNGNGGGETPTPVTPDPLSKAREQYIASLTAIKEAADIEVKDIEERIATAEEQIAALTNQRDGAAIRGKQAREALDNVGG